LYGVGARLDQDPSLFFVLRKADVKDLVSETVNAGKKELLTRSRQKSSRIMEDQADLSGLFGIDLDKGAAPDVPPENTSRKIKDAAGIETLFKRRTKRLTQVAEVIEKSDMDPQKVRNILFRLVQLGKLERVSRGIYRWSR
jgi:predicted Rossmann fold nucleotide-binding protein DprA/Smf involved in DNA uptake